MSFQTVDQLMTSFADTAGTGSITPATMRGMIASAELVLSNVAALRANASTVQSIFITGYSSFNDGGQGLFYLNASDTTSTDNGGTIIVDASNQRWYRVYNNVINVAWFGVKADGTTDDSVNFQKAVSSATSGQTIFIPFNSAILLGATIAFNTSNVTIEGNGWTTVLRRKTAFNNILLNFNASNLTVRNCTVDGNNVATATAADLYVQPGAVSNLIEHCQFINAQAMSVALSGNYPRITGCTFTGTSNTTAGVGVWADNNINVDGIHIDNNVMRNFSLNAIGMTGTNFIIEGNTLYGNQIKTGPGGGQIAIAAVPAQPLNGVIIGNVIETGGSTGTSGIELNGNATSPACNLVISGNTIANQGFCGIATNDTVAGQTPLLGAVITGNIIRNSQTGDGIRIGIKVSDLIISNNRIVDDQASPTQNYGIKINSGSSNNYKIEGNTFFGNVTAPVLDSGTGVNKSISNNIGLDDVVPSVASAAALPIPLNPMFTMTGTTGVTSLTGDFWIGRKITILPAGAVTFTAGNNIGNTVTTTANVPLIGFYNGTNWYFQ